MPFSFLLLLLPHRPASRQQPATFISLSFFSTAPLVERDISPPASCSRPLLRYHLCMPSPRRDSLLPSLQHCPPPCACTLPLLTPALPMRLALPPSGSAHPRCCTPSADHASRPSIQRSQSQQQMAGPRSRRNLLPTRMHLAALLCLLQYISIVSGDASPAAAPTTQVAATPPAPAEAGAPPPTSTAAAPLIAQASPPSPPLASSPPLPAMAPEASTPVEAAAAPPSKPIAASPAAASPAPSTSVANLTSPPPAELAPKSPPPPAVLAPKAAPPKSAMSPAAAPSPAATPDLDISQVAALQQLKVPFDAADPCGTSDDILLCDNSDPPRHLLSLSLRNCAPSAKFTTAALLNLSSLQSLELVNCSVTPVRVPSALVTNLKTFICSESLGKTGTNEKADKLTGVWLSKLTSLEELSVTDVELSVSGLNIIIQNMKGLTQVVVSRTNMPGILPRKTWPDGLQYIDVSGNSIRGTLPSQMRSLAGLKHLDLSSNQIKGVLPNIFGDLQQLQYIDLSGNQFSGPIPGSLPQLRNCSHLDLSKNSLNGSIPANLTLIKTLRYLDLSQNALSGPIPFNNTFLSKLTTLKLGDNSGLCYNHTAIKSKFLSGIPNCITVGDDTGLTAPAPAPASSDLSSSSGKRGGISKGAAAGISVVVILGAAVVVFFARKWWKKRDDGEQFVNMRKGRH